MKYLKKVGMFAAVVGLLLVSTVQADEKCLQDSLGNFYEMRINQQGHEPESGNTYFLVTGLQYNTNGKKYYLVGSGEAFDLMIGIMSFTMMDANVLGRNTTATFKWVADNTIEGSIRRDGLPSVPVDVIDLFCTGE